MRDFVTSCIDYLKSTSLLNQADLQEVTYMI